MSMDISQSNDAERHQKFVANCKILLTDPGQGSHKTTNIIRSGIIIIGIIIYMT